MPASRKYLDPDVIARLRGFKLQARDIVAGFISGSHRSAYHGFSVEFAEHRQYVPGDDIRYIDWRIFGRADRLYIREYEEETNLRCNLLVDASRSMAFRGPQAQYSKFEYACRLAASLAYLLIRNQDAVGLITFDHRVRAKLEPAAGRRHLGSLLEVLERTQPAERTEVKALLHRLAEELRKRSMVVIFSDLLTDAETIADGLDHMCHAGHELIVFHILDDQEWHFPFVENLLFEGLEDDSELLADPQSLRASYLAAVQRFVARVQATCRKHRADYVPVNTREPVGAVLTGYLAQRAGRGHAAHRGQSA